MKKLNALVAASALLIIFSSLAFAVPAQIILIRHGEKPEQGNQLNEQGFMRARALVPYFMTNPAVTRFGRPVAIYAMKPKGPDGSVRPIQTVTPLAQVLHLTVIADYLKEDYSGLVRAVLGNRSYDGKMVLICWEHKAIPVIVHNFAVATATPPEVARTLPYEWDGKAYDRTWILNLAPNGQITSFQDLRQDLPARR